ncbi:MAG: ABC transporter permease subunit [Phycisphaera sp.]|nr:MAG: ABC transporter permease subunit [Phycisphaera sp.]
MLTRPDEKGDGNRKLVRVRTFQIEESPIEAMAISRRDRTFAAADSAGEIRIWHATSGKQLGTTRMPGGAASAITVAPKLDGFYAVNETGVASWRLEPGHPKATFESLFLPVWYEGDQAPSLVYQSTSADDSAESKMSLTPLIFGTFKATVFAMLFAVPVAVMAAIYASEFMSKSLRNKIKPTIEMMASLPSVVLGFIAAMILAPYIRDHLSSVLVGLVVVPICILFGSALWPLLGNRAWRLPQTAQLSVIVLAGLVGIALSSAAGPAIDRALFSLHETEEQLLTGFVDPAQQIPEWAEEKSVFTLGERTRLRGAGLYVLDDRVVEPIDMTDPVIREQFENRRETVLAGSSPFKFWLTGMVGSPVAGWVALMFVPALIIAGFIGSSVGRAHSAAWMPLVRVGGSVLMAVPIAYLLAFVLSAIGFDPRETILGTFTQRNTFVVGIIMGFAVIPIIFTISDDALQSVPNTLRSASLGAGATQWQTAVRVVLPVATSGIFSAIMIGLGRAAGETMIVLMATGNTPVMDWNIFGGLRTLSANIAVELPEADRGGTHYRVLFLCGVVLFVITFVVNTTAEIVRQHFRKRSAML